MAIYTVHAPARVNAPEADPMALTFVKEGFNWPALFFPAIWLIVRRMWLVFVLYIAAAAIIGAATQTAVPFVVAPISLGFAFLFALEANGLRRWTLARNGWRMVGVAEGRNQLEAERRFYSRLLGEGVPPKEAPAVPPPPPPRALPTTPSSDTGLPIVGLFPQGQGS
jgi:hypothetical protein